MKSGRLFIVSAPSGTGKTTLVERLLRRKKRLIRSVSVTTRLPRRGEKDGRDYCFVTKKEFLRRRRKGEFLEWARVFSQYYGTPKKFVEEAIGKGKDVIACLDVQGAMQVKKKWPRASLIFILPPATEELIQRLNKRKTDSTRQINKRIKMARWEMAQAREYDYRIVNDQLSKAVESLRSIVDVRQKKEKPNELRAH